VITIGDLWSTSSGIDPVVSKYKAINAVFMITEKFNLDDFFVDLDELNNLVIMATALIALYSDCSFSCKSYFSLDTEIS
jgi:hypothetical protein